MDDIDWTEGATVWLPENFATGNPRDRLLMEGSLKDAVRFVRDKGSEQGFVVKTESQRTWAGVELWGLTGDLPD